MDKPSYIGRMYIGVSEFQSRIFPVCYFENFKDFSPPSSMINYMKSMKYMASQAFTWENDYEIIILREDKTFRPNERNQYFKNTECVLHPLDDYLLKSFNDHLELLRKGFVVPD